MSRRVWSSRLGGVILVSVAGFGIFGCSPEEEPAAGASVRDSAGVRIVESRNPDWTPETKWSLGAEPSLTIGVVEGPEAYELSQVTQGLRLRDGTIVFGTNSSGELRFFDAAGTHLRSVGGKGEGPGEFGYIGRIGRYGRDSLLVWDVDLRRLSVWDTEGNFARTFNGPPGSSMHDAFEDGAMLGRRSDLGAQMGPGASQDSALLFRFTASGSEEPIGVFFDRESFSGANSKITLPFGRRAVYGVGQGLLHYGDAETYEVRTYSTDGRLLRVSRVDRPRQLVTEEEITAFVDRMTTGGSASILEQRAQMYADLTFPKVHPSYSQLLVDREGNVWVGNGSSTWTVFNTEGVLLGSIEIPVGLTMYEIGDDYVLGRDIGELGVQRVVLYPLLKQQPSVGIRGAGSG